jgi:phospholipid-binding lipoprotein MlaA
MKSINKIISTLLVGSVVGLTGCASQPENENLTPPKRTFDHIEKYGEILAVPDPLEPFNRLMYNFNARFDRYVFLPVVDGYKWITPDPVEKGISNFFDNIREPLNVINNGLQFELEDSGVSLARFVINTTFGLGGLFDAADRIGFYERKEDFGLTLGVWGVGDGPYLVLPLLGPSNLRDATGLAVDLAINYNIDLLNVKDDANKDGLRIGSDALKAVDARANTAFKYFGTGSPFEYELVRYAATEIRKVRIDTEDE